MTDNDDNIASLAIEPQRARLAIAQSLRELADDVEAGRVHWVASFALFTPEAAAERNRAWDQTWGFPTQTSTPLWMTALGGLRSAYLDMEDDLIQVGAGTVVGARTIRSSEPT